VIPEVSSEAPAVPAPRLDWRVARVVEVRRHRARAAAPERARVPVHLLYDPARVRTERFGPTG
jgi:hypothetical protein